MNPSQSLTASSTSRAPFYEKVILSALRRMRRGRLNLTLPSGRSLLFGDIGRSHPPADEAAQIVIKSPDFFKRCVLYGDVGFGESYVDGEWETDHLPPVLRWMILNHETNPGVSGHQLSNALIGCLRRFNELRHALRDNDVAGSRKNIAAHYDLSNELFATFLDDSLTYSCADFSDPARTLEAAQIAKLDRLAKATQIRATDHVLEIGSGWGAFALHLARHYGCRVTTVTVSAAQLKIVQDKIRAAGLADRIEARFQDYRAVTGLYDKVVSIEMLEAVGHAHLSEFFGVVEKCLQPQGLLGLQVITSADSRYEKIRRGVDWIQKHIFPGSLIPSLGALTDAARQSSRLQMHSLYDFGPDYARTLSEWRHRFNTHLPQIRQLGFDEHFLRTWNYYFSYCEAAFALRHISVVQAVYTRPNNPELR